MSPERYIATPGIYLLAFPWVVTATALGQEHFRAGQTLILDADGSLENAQAMAAHEGPRTTKLYERLCKEIMLDEIERIAI